MTYYRFPCAHPVLENVFAKELARYHEIVLLFQGDTSKGREQTWHHSKVLLTPELSGNHGYSKFINKILRCQRLFLLLSLMWRNRIKIILIRDMPLIAFLIAPLRLFLSFKLYFQYTAPLGDISIAYSKADKTISRFKSLLFGYCFNFLIQQVLILADIVFPITEFHKKDLLPLTNADKLVPITMGVDEDWLNSAKTEILYLKELKEKYFLISYLGTLSFARNPRFILKIFAEVKEICPNSKMILIGKTNFPWEEKQLRTTCSDLGVENDVIFTGQLDRNSVRDSLYYCDLSISAIPPEAYYKISSPTKIYESLANGVPVVGNKGIYEQEKVILESGGGLLVEYEPSIFCNAIVRLLNNTKLRRIMGTNGREYVLNNYSYGIIAKRISPYFL